MARSSITESPRRRDTPRGGRGFTLIELIMALLVMSILAMGVATFFTSTRSLYLNQIQATEMQQGARGGQRELIRLTRMLGRGGFPAGSDDNPLPHGLAIDVRNNVDTGTSIVTGGDVSDPPEVLEGTDILTVRGVFESPIYQINHADPTSFVQNPDNELEVDLTLDSTTTTGVRQDLSILIDIVERSQQGDLDGAQPVREAIFLASPRDSRIYCVLELDPQRSNVENPGSIRLRLLLPDPDEDDRLANSYETLCPNQEFPRELFQSRIGFAGILEERRYYIRKDHVVAGDQFSRLSSKLSRARLYPGTDIPYKEDPLSLEQDLAYEVIDLQVSLGFDSSNGGSWSDDSDSSGVDDSIFESDDGLNDDWLYNSLGDEADKPPWTNLPEELAYPDLYYIRLSTLSRSRQPSRNTLAPILTMIEDHNYEGNRLNDLDERSYQRILTQTTIDMRNLG